MKVNKNLFVWVAVVAFAAVCAVWLFAGGTEPIEDTNGPGDHSLAVITDENIIQQDLDAVNPIRVSRASADLGAVTENTDVKLSSQGFSGVYEVMCSNFVLSSDVELVLDYLKVSSGNFKMVVLLDDEIVATIAPSDEPIEFQMEDVVGTVSLRIAGESADYEFAMSSIYYDTFSHSNE